MYLKSIRLEGFKSFANKTIFDLQKGVTAIIGPNGSGKSNIVDAVRWVLGEQSVKSLRGYSMSDVIFSGTEVRNGLNKASVTLTFDNADKYVNSEFLEIAVKRVIYKTGENDYFINDAKVRLKDIQELFIDANIGNDSLNIISQGSVTDIVNSKPIERRAFIESAAGVLKYKKRKEESIKKLDKTKENLNSINLVIDELKNTIEPLQRQAEVAEKYLNLKNNLKDYEVALISNDITKYNIEIKENEKEENILKQRIEELKVNNYDSKIEEAKLNIYKIDDEINASNSRIIRLTEQISSLDSEKRINLERKKYEYSNDLVQSNLINLKETELSLIKDIALINDNIDATKEKIKMQEEELHKKEVDLNSINSKRKILEDNLNNLNKEKINLENAINILENNINNNSILPSSVKSVLNNPRLKGIHNTVSSLITVDDNYATCLEVAMGASHSHIIVDSEESAKDAINFLKTTNTGRATFLPINIIKPRYITKDIIERLETINGYVGILSGLISYDSKYKNIMENLFGNVIVTKDIDSMNLISKIMEYKYKVVSMDGSITYAGGSISGGNSNKNSIISYKKELNNKSIRLTECIQDIANVTTENNNILNEFNILNTNILDMKSNLAILNNNLNNLLNDSNDKNSNLNNIKSEINGLNNLEDNLLDKEIDNLMNKINELTIEKDKLENRLNILKEDKNDLNSKLSDLEKMQNESNSAYRECYAKLNKTTANLSKLNVLLDNLLLELNEEYNMTYEASRQYELEEDENIVRSNVQKLKRDIKLLGEVNTGSIEEYKRLNERNNFLINQKEDLEVSINELLNIIDDMDKIMIDKFKTTYEQVSLEFSRVFKVMFGGGSGSITLTDSNDYLNTGIDLEVCPPGKKIQNIQSLSGGEKSLTAICLLFAILNVNPSPFIILDEVEAALDEANVELFGDYLDAHKNITQYILITHKKSMMEHADVLYGITMEEAGVSKVVGVKLEDFK